MQRALGLRTVFQNRAGDRTDSTSRAFGVIPARPHTLATCPIFRRHHSDGGRRPVSIHRVVDAYPPQMPRSAAIGGVIRCPSQPPEENTHDQRRACRAHSLPDVHERRSCATGATSRSRWPRLSFLVTCSPTSCAVSTGSDRRQPRHERRHPVPSRRRRQDRCARIGPDRRQKMPFRVTNAANWSSIIRIGARMAVIRRRVARRAVSRHTQRAGKVPYGESRFSC